jgi:hypothetical protein
MTDNTANRPQHRQPTATPTDSQPNTAPTQLKPMPSEGRQPRHQIPKLDTQCSTWTPDAGLQHSILDLQTRCWTFTPDTGLRHSILDCDTRSRTTTPDMTTSTLDSGLGHPILIPTLVGTTPFETPPFCNIPLWHIPSWHISGGERSSDPECA